MRHIQSTRPLERVSLERKALKEKAKARHQREKALEKVKKPTSSQQVVPGGIEITSQTT